MQSKGKKVWYARPWAIAIWICIAVPVLLSVVPLGNPDSDDASHLSMHFGSINANDRTTTGSTMSGAGTAFFSAEHVVVMVRTDHRVARRIGRALAKQLEGLGFIKRVDLLMPGEYPESGQPAPNFFVVLEMPSFSARGLLIAGRKVKATVNVNLSRDPAYSNNSYRDRNTAPFAHVSMHSSLEHESVSRGYETAAARYQLVIDDISGQIGGTVVKTLSDWYGTYHAPGVLPAGFMPAYVPPPDDLPLPEHTALEPVFTGHDVMVRNRTDWLMECTIASFEVLQDVHAQLLEDDWRVEPEILQPADFGSFFVARKGSAVFEGFEDPASFGIHETDKPMRLVFRYENRLEREFVLSALDDMIADPDLPPETGLAFMSCMNADQRTRLLESWMDRPVLPFQARLAVVRELEHTGRKKEALARLQTLYAAALLAADGETDEVKKLGREITGDKNWKPALPTEEEFIAAGARPVETSPFEFDIALNETARFLAPTGEDAELVLLSLTIKPSVIPEGLYTFELSNRSGAELDSAGSSSRTPHLREHPWKGQISYGLNAHHFRAKATETGPDRFRVELEIR
ncbi:hypothetical protein P4E94_15905 [Pontiellaceae bacterium B12219]|nr:hypothetical protein [Pontiellaceae bacterium B12219]